MLGAQALGVGLADVAERDLGVGEAADEVFVDFEHAAFKAQRRGEGRVYDLDFVAYVDAFDAHACLLERGDGGLVADHWRAERLELSFGEREEFIWVVAVGEVHVGDAGLAGAVGAGDAPVFGGRGVLDVFFAVVDGGEVDFASIAAGGVA